MKILLRYGLSYTKEHCGVMDWGKQLSLHAPVQSVKGTPEFDRECSTEDEDTGQSKRKKKEDKVSSIISDLKKRHGDSYTQMQYRIWGEMISGGLHSSTSDPPSTLHELEEALVETNQVQKMPPHLCWVN